MTAVSQTTSLETWFDDLIATLRVHQVSLETDTANKDVKTFYNTLLGGNTNEIAKIGKELSHRQFIPQILVEYLSLVEDKMPLKLAFDMSGSEVLVWAEIEDNDEQLEHKLIMTEAKVNSQYHQFGYDLTSMIVEKSETLSIPNHYSIFKS